MSEFKVVGYEPYPEDKYIKEVIYIEVSGGYRHGYTHKIMQDGGSFWDVMGASVTSNGKKEFLKAVKYADNFLQEDIKDFLKKRKWETVRFEQPVREQARAMDEMNQPEFLF